jgi:hypothetical protein
MEDRQGRIRAELVGRDELVDELVERAHAAVRPIVVAGPPGIGKSALTEAVVERLTEVGWSCVVVRCTRRHVGAAQHPFAAAMRAEPGSGPQDAEEPGRPSAAVVRWLERRAGERPQLVVVEDVHDADPTTLALLAELAEPGGRWALIVTTRNDDDVGSALAGTPAEIVRLGPLDRQAGRRLVRRLAAGRPLGAAVTNAIVDRSGGVPLFIRELTAATVAAATASGTWRAVEVDAVPSSLQASLMGRLDRLGELKTTAQRCAAVAGQIDLATAALVVGRDRRSVAAELDALVDEGVLAAAGPGSFQFAHPLLEEAAYESLLKRERHAIHARLADHFASLPAAPAEVRAVHLDAAGRHAEAARYWCRAANGAIQRSDLAEAAAIARRALTAVARLDAGEETDRLERRALMLLTLARVMSLSGDAELSAAAERVRLLARRAGDDGQFVVASVLLVSSLQALGDYERAEDVVVETIDAVGGRVGPELDGLLQHFLGSVTVWRGRVDDGRRLLEPLVAEPPVAQPGSRDVAGVSTVCSLWSLVGLVDAVQARPDLAEQRFATATEFAIESEVPQALCLTRSTRAIARQLAGDAAGVYELVEPTLELALELGDDWWVVWAQVLLGWSMASLAGDESGVGLIEEAIAHQGPLRQLSPYFHGLHGAALGSVGRPADGLAPLRHGLEVAGTTGERFFVPVLHRIESELLVSMRADEVAVAAARRRVTEEAEAQAQWSLVPPADGVDAG